MKKRIAIWTHGGLGSGMNAQGQPCIQRLITRLSVHYAVSVYALVSPPRDFAPDGFSVYTPGKNVRWSTLKWLSLVAKFIAHNRRARYDLLYGLWGYPSGFLVVLLGKCFGRPSVIHLQGGDAAYVPSINYGIFCHPVRRLLCKWAYSRCSLLIALTDFQREFLIRFGIERPVEVIPYGIDTQMFQYKVPVRDGPLIRCLHVGNQTPVKDQDTLVRAFAILSARVPAALTLVGEDHNNGWIRRLCADLQIEDQVSFAGPQPYAELPKYYHASDVLMTTSLYEGQGLVFTEAAACGTLLAGTRVGMLADMGEGCGIIVGTGDAETLANEIETVINSPEQSDAKRTAAKIWSTEKDEEYTVARVREELNKLLFQPKRAKHSVYVVKGYINSLLNRLLPSRLVFKRIYEARKRQNMESLSGPGSALGQTVAVVDIVSSIISQYNISAILDIPCGDFNWMRRVDLNGATYHGADILEELIAINRRKYESPNRKFSVVDLLANELPKADLILCRDCLVHFSYRHINRALRNIRRSGARYLLATTFPESINRNITTGDWFTLNLQAPPFSFPQPLGLFNERHPEKWNETASKSLGLWRIEDLPKEVVRWR